MTTLRPSLEAGRAARTSALAAVLGGLAAVAAAGCSQTTGAQPRAGDCPPFAVVDWMPAGAAADVPTDTVVRLAFSGYPDPATVDGNVILSSGLFVRFGSYAVDLITRSVRFRPYSSLQPGVTFQITVLPDALSLQGCPARQELRTFRTGDGPTSPPPPPPPAPPTLAAVLPIFAASCGGSGCHRGSAAGGGACLDAPAQGLSLCDADALRALVGVDARQVSDLKRVAPSDPARSYLLRKVIVPDPAQGPGEGGPAVVPGTLGGPMPPGIVRLDDAQVRLISDWIAGGARP